MPANDYDTYQPTIQLRRPLAITGYPGLPFRTLAYELAAMTGLSLIDVDRWIEHQVGTSREHSMLPHPRLPPRSSTLNSWMGCWPHVWRR